MKLEYVEMFVDATVRVLEQVLQEGFGRGDVCLVAGKGAVGDIAVTIPLSGEVAGAVTLQMSRDTAEKLFHHASGQSGEGLPALGLDYLKELGNMIAGAAASALNDAGYGISVAPPLGDGDWTAGGVLQGMEACRIPIFSSFGSMTVNVTLTAE